MINFQKLATQVMDMPEHRDSILHGLSDFEIIEVKKIMHEPVNNIDHGKIYDGSSDKKIYIHGNWKKGWVLDLHTIKSVPLGDGKFETTYTKTGKALNELKYHQNYTKIDDLATDAVNF